MDEISSTIAEATQMHATAQHWVPYYRDVIGIGGLLHARLTTPEQRAAFAAAGHYGELLELIADLRGRSTQKQTAYERDQMITIRVPSSMHAVLVLESRDAGTSMQKMAITKLMEPLDMRHLPEYRGAVRGRRAKPELPKVAT